MFSQEYDFPDDVSDGDPDAEGNESSDDDDLKRVLRHIGGVPEKPADDDDFEQSMEDDLNNAVLSLEKNRVSVVKPSLPGVSDSDLNFFASGSCSLATDAASATENNLLKTGKVRKNVKFEEKPKEFYDPAYFDSDDEEPESALKNDGTRATKKHPVLSNDELFYDPKVDDEDQRWVDSQRKTYHPKMGRNLEEEAEAPPKKKSREKPASTTDAVLNCPACMTTVCLDCQRHEIYHQQYRAMFVLNCVVEKTRTLICKAKKQPQKKRRTADSEPDEFVAVDGAAGGLSAKEDVFFPVKCRECSTEVGVVDYDEIYHFFNVIASHP